MSARVFLGLLVITVLAVAGAAIVAFERPSAAPVRYVDEPAFPALRADPDAVAKVTLTTSDGSITLVRETADRWAALERFGYPVDRAKVRALIVALADMRLIEAKTRLPERYPRLEVEDPAAADAKSRLLRAESADGKVLAAAILGKRQHRLTGNQSAGTYLRRPGEEQSWLASGGVDLDTAVIDWLDDQIVDLDPARIGRIEIRPESGKGYLVRRNGAGEPLQLADLAEGERVKDDADLGRLAGVLAPMRLEDVRPRAELEWPAAHQVAVATTLDGLELTVELARIDDEPWARLDARAVDALAPPASPAPQPESVAADDHPVAEGAAPAGGNPAAAEDAGSSEGVEEVEITPDESPPPPDPAGLAARLQPWAFKISSQLFDRLTRPRSEWLEDSGTS
jgi:hypothetical protein